ncbi:MAG TPA: lipid II flippase MurJ, partial [Longilinea sp.]|nr:lipid II flippase MurJ [Longilinea sp.]
FYARKRVWFPFMAALLNLGVFFLLAGVLFKPWGAQGISLGDSLAFTSEAIILLSILVYQLRREQNVHLFEGDKQLWGTLFRGLVAAIVGGGCTWLVLHFGGQILPELVLGIAAMGIGLAAALPLVWKEVKVFLNL